MVDPSVIEVTEVTAETAAPAAPEEREEHEVREVRAEPAEPEEPEVRVRRRHRMFAVPSGLLLFVCMFLPITEQCGEAVYPYEAPPACVPYVLGLVAAVRALMDPALRASAVRGARVLTDLSIGFWALATAWFTAWTFDSHAMVGAPLSLACSAWLMVAAVLRHRDLGASAIDRSGLPRAQLGGLRLRAPMPVMVLVVVMIVSFIVAAAARPAGVAPGHGVDDIDLSGLYAC